MIIMFYDNVLKCKSIKESTASAEPINQSAHSYIEIIGVPVVRTKRYTPPPVSFVNFVYCFVTDSSPINHRSTTD